MLRATRESLHGRQVCVDNLPCGCGWQDVKDLMRQAGNVVRVNVISSPYQASSRAMVLFASASDAQRALVVFQGYQYMNGLELKLTLDNSLGQLQEQSSEIPQEIQGLPLEQRPCQVAISNISFIVGWQDLKDLFREAGTVHRADIVNDPRTNKSRGQGTVTYADWKEAVKAVHMFNGFVWFGRKIEVRLDMVPQQETSASWVWSDQPKGSSIKMSFNQSPSKLAWDQFSTQPINSVSVSPFIIERLPKKYVPGPIARPKKQ